MVYRDLSNGYIVAEILSWYYPQDIELQLFMNASSINLKVANWQRLKKVCFSLCLIHYLHLKRVLC